MPTPYTTTQGTQTPAGIVNFDPNTGQRLGAGQSVNVAEGGNTYGATTPIGGTQVQLNPLLVNAPTASNPVTTVTKEQSAATPNTYSFAASSDPTRTAENDLTSKIASLLNAGTGKNDAISTAYNSVLDNYTKYSDALEKRRAETAANINRQFDITKTQTQDAQKNEMGSTNAGLLRTGGYLGESGSAQGVINNLGEKQRLEISTLEAKRQSALLEAQNAIDDKQFAIANSKAAEIKGLEKEINDRKDTFFNQVLNLTQESRAQDTATRQKIDDQLKAFSMVDPKTIDPTALANIDSFYKTPGFAQAYLTASNAAAKAKTQKEQLDASKSYVDLLSSVPAGMSISLPDGSKATGIGKAGDYEVFNKEDKSGKVTIVRFNKNTGSFTEYNAGAIGTPSATAGESIDVVKVLGPVTKEFGKLEKDKEGFIKPITQDALDAKGNAVTNTVKSPTAIYNAYRQTFIQTNPDVKNAGKIFDDNYIKYLPLNDRGNISKDSV